MIFAATADLHITDKCPKNRKDGYFDEIMKKFNAIMKITANTQSKLLVVAGDFFDSPTVPYNVTREILRIIKQYEIKILVVPGQHDLRYHKSGLSNTPLGVLEAGKVVKILSCEQKITIDGISFIGAGWNDEPEVEADVILMHRMITKKDPLFPGQTDYSTAAQVLRKYPWAKCIISGDNHQPHSLNIDGRLQLNCGSMIRSSKIQIGYMPRINLINTDLWKFKKIALPVKPDEEVFDFDKIEREELKKKSREDAQKDIEKFIDSLSIKTEDKPEFQRVLATVIDEAKPSKRIVSIINNIMEKVK